MANIVLTNAGLAALVNAEQTGTNPIEITSVQFGAGKYTPVATQTGLQSPFKTLTTIAGGAVGDNVIHLEVSDTGPDTYTVYEYGLFLEDGTLFGVYSQTTPIISKATGSSAMLAVDLVVQGATPSTVVFGDTNFSNPPATSATAGVVQLATSEETKLGVAVNKAITPAGLSARVATETSAGIVQRATDEETQAGENGFKFITPKSLWLSIKKAVNEIVKPLIVAAALAAVPIGSVFHYMGTTVPEGFLLCNGASLTKEEYPELFEVIGTKCGSADSAHFNIPDTHHRFLEGTTVLEEVGKYVAAGLPNSSGVISNLAVTTDGATATGAFSVNNDITRVVYGGTGFGGLTSVAFSLSAGNVLFGASDTNQPSSLRSFVLIRAY